MKAIRSELASRVTRRARACALFFLALAANAFAFDDRAAAPVAAASAAEEVVFIRRPATWIDAQLETTLFKPGGGPPWPLVVLNHGSLGLANPHQQERYRPLEIAAFFTERGYLVAAPMRQGFARSSGVYAWNCDHEQYALRYAGDVSAVIAALVEQGLADAQKVLVVGQSNGGMVALGYAAESAPGRPLARGIINFSGGINSSRPNCDWQAGMISAARALGARTRIPSLWIYTANDSIFPPAVSEAFFAAYHEVQPRSTMKLYPAGGHGISNTRQGVATWGSEVDSFLLELGLPARPR